MAIGQLKKEQGKIREGLKVVKEECEERHRDMTERVEKLGQEVKTETKEGLEAVRTCVKRDMKR